MILERDFENPHDVNATEGKIVEGAYACFKSLGVRKTTMADIATEANVSRATVYKYFSKKNDILKRICHLEMIKVNQVVRERVPSELSFADKLTEALAISVEISKDNYYIDRIFRQDDFWENEENRGSALFEWHSSQWMSLLTRARKRGEIATDLDEKRVTRWLSYCQQTLMLTFDDITHSDFGMRDLIRRFMVQPILAAALPASVDGEQPIYRNPEDENAALRAIVLDQALEIFNLKNARASADS